MVHQVGVRRKSVDRSCATAPGVRDERFVRALRAEEAAHELLQILDRRAAAPEARTGSRWVFQSIDENRGLPVLGRAGPLDQRYADVAADVGQHDPEEAMCDVVQALEYEQLLRLEAVGAEQPVREEGDRQPARLGKGGQEQRIGPDQETRSEAAERGSARTALPEDASD